MAARNRTAAAEGRRQETQGLKEIDNYATNAKHKNEVEKEDKVGLRMVQSGSSWTKEKTAKTGRVDETFCDDLCELCRKEKETSDHVWTCEKLESKRRELDIELAEANPEDLTPAIRRGVACAMSADPERTFWGTKVKEAWNAKRRWLYGCDKIHHLKAEVRKLIEEIQEREEEREVTTLTAREYMEYLTAQEEGVSLTMPKMGG